MKGEQGIDSDTSGKMASRDSRIAFCPRVKDRECWKSRQLTFIVQIARNRFIDFTDFKPLGTSIAMMFSLPSIIIRIVV